MFRIKDLVCTTEIEMAILCLFQVYSKGYLVVPVDSPNCLRLAEQTKVTPCCLNGL